MRCPPEHPSSLGSLSDLHHHHPWAPPTRSVIPHARHPRSSFTGAVILIKSKYAAVKTSDPPNATADPPPPPRGAVRSSSRLRSRRVSRGRVRSFAQPAYEPLDTPSR
ncbi:hypothetical protein AAFF_G00167010 [Aldrovandia affinis]|uniref:Uncharacterized protein n=1 Tax=Aldrovandia affinis TaxID=143900 RepID=A0AAD7RMN2_9TELE|nr:hypothetical protein AAFF_G00167010 [Aldrovandia affinis]